MSHRLRGREVIVVYALVMLAGAGAALLVAARVDGIGPLARPEFATITTLPLAIYPVALVGVVTLILSFRVWWVGLATFFVWLPLEDLVRKLADNDIRVYFVKDVLLGFAVLGILPHLRDCWRRPLGSVWLPTVGVFAVAVIYSLPSLAISPQLPLIGLHVRFLFAVLFPIGVYLGQDVERLRPAIFGLTAIGAAACAVGIVQVFLGPTFLNPTEANPLLPHLVVIKDVGAEVVRPSGLFADVSRFASMTIVSTTLGLCALRLSVTPLQRRLSSVAVAVAVAAAFASGSRTAVALAILLAAFGLFGQRAATARFRRTFLIAAAVPIVAALSFGGTLLAESTDRVTFYTQTLNPTSEQFEAGTRSTQYIQNAITGIRAGGVIGRGTGTESVGRQYIGLEEVATGTESGWGSVGAEWGIGGLLVWITWSVLWTRRAVLLARPSGRPADNIAPLIAAYVALLLLVMFSLGAGFFDNYVANVHFWLLSGIAFAPGIRSMPNDATDTASSVHSDEAAVAPLLASRGR